MLNNVSQQYKKVNREPLPIKKIYFIRIIPKKSIEWRLIHYSIMGFMDISKTNWNCTTKWWFFFNKCRELIVHELPTNIIPRLPCQHSIERFFVIKQETPYKANIPFQFYERCNLDIDSFVPQTIWDQWT